MVTAALLTLEINKLTETKNAEAARAHQVKTGDQRDEFKCQFFGCPAKERLLYSGRPRRGRARKPKLNSRP